MDRFEYEGMNTRMEMYIKLKWEYIWVQAYNEVRSVIDKEMIKVENRWNFISSNENVKWNNELRHFALTIEMYGNEGLSLKQIWKKNLKKI